MGTLCLFPQHFGLLYFDEVILQNWVPQITPFERKLNALKQRSAKLFCTAVRRERVVDLGEKVRVRVRIKKKKNLTKTHRHRTQYGNYQR